MKNLYFALILFVALSAPSFAQSVTMTATRLASVTVGGVVVQNPTSDSSYAGTVYQPVYHCVMTWSGFPAGVAYISPSFGSVGYVPYWSGGIDASNNGSFYIAPSYGTWTFVTRDTGPADGSSGTADFYLASIAPGTYAGTCVAYSSGVTNVSFTVTFPATAPVTVTDTGTQDSVSTDSAVFQGIFGPISGYLQLLIKNHAIIAILVGFVLCAWMLLRKFTKKVAKP